MSKRRRILLRTAFVLYTVLMLWLLFGQRYTGSLFMPDWEQMRDRISLKPFHTIGNYLWVLEYSGSAAMRRLAVANLVGNVVMFVPLGYFLPVILKPMQAFWRMLLFVLLLICAVELLQLVTLLGSCDIDDLLLNLPGTVLGWLLWKATGKK